MNATIQEWIDKAEGDYRTAGRELHVPDEPNFDASIFHAQQCIEKLMKALLIRHHVTPPKIHDLPALDQLLGPVLGKRPWKVEDLRYLSRGAIGFRYPGESAIQSEAEEAYPICTRLRTQLLPYLK